MAEFQYPVQRDYFDKQADTNGIGFVPYWARCQVQYAQNLLECSDEPIVYDHNDEDYQDNCFFFPEDSSWSPPKEWVVDDDNFETETDTTSDSRGIYDDSEDYGDYSDSGIMIPGLPDIKMLDAEALGDLLEDNLSLPEITSIMYMAQFPLLQSTQMLTGPGCLLQTAPSLHMPLLYHCASCAISVPRTVLLTPPSPRRSLEGI